MYLHDFWGMGLLGRRGKDDAQKTKCDVCGTDLHTPERLERHMKKAHGNIPEKKLDPNSDVGGGMW